jgi:hypothetical protein
MNGIKEMEYKVQKEYIRVLCNYNESMESMRLWESQLGVIIDKYRSFLDWENDEDEYVLNQLDELENNFKF